MHVFFFRVCLIGHHRILSRVICAIQYVFVVYLSYICAVFLVTQLCPRLCYLMVCSPPGPSGHGGSPGKNTGVGWHALLQGIFPTLGLNPGLLHCRQIIYWVIRKAHFIYVCVCVCIIYSSVCIFIPGSWFTFLSLCFPLLTINFFLISVWMLQFYK